MSVCLAGVSALLDIGTQFCTQHKDGTKSLRSAFLTDTASIKARPSSPRPA